MLKELTLEEIKKLNGKTPDDKDFLDKVIQGIEFYSQKDIVRIKETASKKCAVVYAYNEKLRRYYIVGEIDIV